MALLGARQVGKTTLARRIAASWPGSATIFDLEVATDREALSRAPARLLGHSEGLVVIDEVQRLPQLFEALRPVCDDPDRSAVFLLLGSAFWDLVKGVSESLAGRILFVDASDFSLGEVSPQAVDASGCGAASPGPAWPLRSLPGRAGCSRSRGPSSSGHRGTGTRRLSGCAWPLLENAGPLSRSNLECFATGTLHGRGRENREPIPRSAGGRVHDPRPLPLVREPGQTAA